MLPGFPYARACSPAGEATPRRAAALPPLYVGYFQIHNDDNDDDNAIELRAVGSEPFYLRSWHQERQETRAWKPAGGASLSVRCFEGEFVVYNPLSGHTHYLDIVSGQVLTLIAGGACATDAICSRIAAFLEVDGGDEVVALVHQTLEKLEAAKLIERDAE